MRYIFFRMYVGQCADVSATFTFDVMVVGKAFVNRVIDNQMACRHLGDCGHFVRNEFDSGVRPDSSDDFIETGFKLLVDIAQRLVEDKDFRL